MSITNMTKVEGRVHERRDETLKRMRRLVAAGNLMAHALTDALDALELRHGADAVAKERESLELWEAALAALRAGEPTPRHEEIAA